MNYDIIIIGAGTSAGFLLAFLDERESLRKLKILVLEKTREPFRKIYGSGNGRCNFSNTDIAESAYYSLSGDDAWKKSAFESVARLDLKQFFFDHGIPSYNDEYGRLMPYTNSAKTVGKFFERYLKSGTVTLHCNAEAVEAAASGAGFTVTYAQAGKPVSARAAAVVYACGGSAYPQMGTDGSGFDILRRLGHTITRQAAGIVPLETRETAFHALAGLKMECRITAGAYARKGELLFTKYGISGPNVLFASNAISLGLIKGPVTVSVDFLPEESFTPGYFRAVHAAAKEKTVSAVFGGTVNAEFLKIFMLKYTLKDRLALSEVDNVYARLKDVELTVTRTRPLQEAQVSLGGVSAGEIDPAGFESRLHRNLFVMGEALDYTGGCGGYNIHWCAATARGIADRLGDMAWK